MKTLLFFLFTVFASTMFMWSAIFTGKDIVTHAFIALGLWALFVIYATRRRHVKY
ncbi:MULTISPECIES: hypothetical protein [Mucilaginibacter]|uniref:hypothetical protein n=1 Tax=Mucilaginibacter TaxID=423349 RepID=UPI00031C07FC|nr:MULTISPECIES: hypothetical protein [Mucilaginibacter]